MDKVKDTYVGEPNIGMSPVSRTGMLNGCDHLLLLATVALENTCRRPPLGTPTGTTRWLVLDTGSRGEVMYPIGLGSRTGLHGGRTSLPKPRLCRKADGVPDREEARG